MKSEGGYYKHYIPDINLSIEKGTDKVPSDGKYHIVRDGHIIDSFKFRMQAEGKFKKLIEASGYKPSISQKIKLDPGDETVERYLISKAIFWAEGPKYKDKRGKGGRGGI